MSIQAWQLDYEGKEYSIIWRLKAHSSKVGGNFKLAETVFTTLVIPKGILPCISTADQPTTAKTQPKHQGVIHKNKVQRQLRHFTQDEITFCFQSAPIKPFKVLASPQVWCPICAPLPSGCEPQPVQHRGWQRQTAGSTAMRKLPRPRAQKETHPAGRSQVATRDRAELFRKHCPMKIKTGSVLRHGISHPFCAWISLCKTHSKQWACNVPHHVIRKRVSFSSYSSL